jgi:hypothetical protein
MRNTTRRFLERHAVVQYLIHEHKYPPEHIAAIGYGENKGLPRGPDEDLTAWRSKNRRVVFLIKNPDSPAKTSEVAEVSEGH